MHPRDVARQRAEALFKPKAATAGTPAVTAPSPFDGIKRQAALAHSIGKLRRSDRSSRAILGGPIADEGRES